MPNKTAVPSDCRISAPAPVATDKRGHAQDEREGRHQDRTKPGACRMHCALKGSSTLVFPLARKFDNQNCVFRSQADKYNKPDLSQDVDRHVRARAGR